MVPAAAKIHKGATITPHFREFVPAWVVRQPWYPGAEGASLTPVGYFRFEDPDGQVGIETHLWTDGSALYQIPLTYRGAPIEGAADALVTTTEHSVLGTRWIYDAVADPVWLNELLRLVQTNGVSDPSQKSGVGPAEARGHCLTSADLTPDTVTIDLRRVVTDDRPADAPDVAGLVLGTWHPDGPDTTTTATGCLAVLHTTTGSPVSPK
jgi:Maltokinase N-terminal cap domain